MALAMAQPWRYPDSGVYYLRQRTPGDLSARLKGTSVTLPVGEEFITVRVGGIVQVSLRTREPREAKARHAVADSALRQFWAAQKAGPRTLSTKQAVSLAGTAYIHFAEAIGDGVVGRPEGWAKMLDENQAARAGEYGHTGLMIGHAAKVAASMEERFGNLANKLLLRERLVVDAQSRTRLLTALASAMDDAATQLIEGMRTWLAGWKRRGWRTGDKKPVKNEDLWRTLDALAAERVVEWVWVRGHAGYAENERVDQLADAEARECAKEIGWSEASRYGFTAAN